MSTERPRIYIDESLPHQLAPALGKAFRRATFSSHKAERLTGVLDLPLFETLAARQFDVIVTKDLAQTLSPSERRGLRRAPLHWVGLREPEKARGVAFYGAIVSALAASVPTVMEDIARPPSAYFVRCEHLQWQEPIHIEYL